MNTRAVGRLTLLSGLIAFACNVLLMLSIDFNFDAFARPALIFSSLTSARAAMFRWGMITDIWGYYLLVVPAVLLVRERSSSPWRHLTAASGGAYALIGSMRAAILAATGTYLLRQSLVTADAAQLAARDSFLLVYHVVNNGLWNLLEMGLCGVFLFGAAAVIRPLSVPLQRLTVVLAVAAILDTVGNTLEVSAMAEVGLNAYLALAPVWAIWLGVVWMRAPERAS